ncbi:MAG: hypothetical protein KAF91_31835 [Nostoc sp. TH1S01]|nr:hypothetical protein [Nostoc sp. TH1S01]
MATQYEAMFEAPAAHGTSSYSNPYANPEFENEWESSNMAFENEWENSNMAFENEWEASNGYGNPEFENEWEASNGYGNPELTNEWEANPYSNPELAQEGEYFFKQLGQGLRSLGRMVAPLAKKLAPNLAQTLVGMIPGVGAVAAPLAGRLVGSLLREAEMEVAQMEASFFGSNEAEAEVANNEAAYEAALTEFLASQAAEATTEAEAEAAIAASLPITITIMGGKRALRPVMPVMTQATGRLTQVMRQQGAAGQQLLRTIPTIQRQTVATLKAAARAGQPINSATALRAMATATNRVLSNPQKVQQAVVRNAVLRQRTAPPHPGRVATTTKCPKCAAAGR